MKVLYILLAILVSNLFSSNKLIIHYGDNSSQEIILETITNISFETDYIPIDYFKITSNPLIIDIGEGLNLEYDILPQNSTNKRINWTSLNENIARVDDEGSIMGVSPGETKIIGTTEMRVISDTIDVEVLNSSNVRINSSKFNIYPNPTTSFIKIEMEHNFPFEVIITDLIGNVVYSDFDKDEIDISFLSNSIYMIYINQKNKLYSYKFIKN
jgi:hypothetical protein